MTKVKLNFRGLSKHWSSFPIYCSPITSRLIQSKLRVDPKWIRAIDLNQTHVIDNSVEVRYDFILALPSRIFIQIIIKKVLVL